MMATPLGGTWCATAVVILPIPDQARQADIITVDCPSQKKIMVEFARTRSAHTHAYPGEHRIDLGNLRCRALPRS